MSNYKKNIGIFLFGDEQIRQYKKTGFFSLQEDRDNVHYFLAGPISDLNTFEKNQVTQISLRHDIKSRFLIFIQKLFFYHATKESSSYNTTFDQSKLKRFICALFFLPFYQFSLYRLLNKFLETITKPDNNLLKILQENKIHVSICPITTVRQYHVDLVFACRYLGTHCIMIPIAWDNITSKMLLPYVPDTFFVWGNEMAIHAKKIFRLSDHQVTIVGVPQYEIFLNNNHPNSIKREAFRNQFQLPLDKIIILVAGSLRAFDEISLLKRLNDIIESKYPDSIHIFYRPHPLRDPRIKEAKLEPENQLHITLDPSVSISSESSKPIDGIKSQSNYDYLGLYQAIDAVISPFSTMLLEGALFGKPCLGIGFNDGIHYGPKATENMAKTEHFKYLSSRDWFINCQNNHQLETDFNKLIKLLKQPKLSKIIQRDTNYIIPNLDKKSSAQRVVDALNTLSKN